MAENLKKKTIASLLWTFLEKFGTLGMAFVSNLVLARLLMPEDFGAIGMLNIFIAISGAFMIGGLSSAIIQKKDITNKDLSTVFVWNLVSSVLFYVILYFVSPYVAVFYNIGILEGILKVYGITLILVALSVVQQAWMQKQLRFKELAIRNLISSLIGLIVGIILAFLDFGVWSLVFSNLAQQCIASLMIWRISTWRPQLIFDKSSFKTLFSFGGMMLLTSLFDRVYVNIQGLLIGKQYSASELGMYNQAKKLEDVPNGSMSYIVSTVTFPLFSRLQDERELLLSALKKNLIATTYVNFPLIVLLMLIAHPLIVLLYGEKWVAVVPYFQILCLGGLLYTLNSVNSNIVKSLGKGKLFFIADVTIKCIGFMMLLIGVRISVYGVLVASIIMQYVEYFCFSLLNRKLINYGVWEQIKDVSGSFMLSVIMGIFVSFASLILPFDQFFKMPIQVFLYIVLYILFSRIFKMKAFYLMLNVVKEFKKTGK